jgi:hypothetical protein
MSNSIKIGDSEESVEENKIFGYYIEIWLK